MYHDNGYTTTVVILPTTYSFTAYIYIYLYIHIYIYIYKYMTVYMLSKAYTKIGKAVPMAGITDAKQEADFMLSLT